MRTSVRLVLAPLLILAAAGTARAQEARFQLAAAGGVTVERSEDGLAGTVPALGLGASVALNPRWRGEVEFWLPGYLEDARGEPKHRDILYGFAAVRRFEAGRVHPYGLAGLTLSRTEDWFTFCTAMRVPPMGGSPARALVSCDAPDVIDVRREKNVGTDGYLLAGGGVEVAVSRRVSLVADVRLNLAPASVLVRPRVGLAIAF